LGVNILLTITAIDCVARDFGKPSQCWIGSIPA
jgi:hypothetical protein